MDTARARFALLVFRFTSVGRCRQAIWFRWTAVLGLFLMPAMASGSSLAVDTVLFVCEHGSAKSVIAAEQFNKAATARGLPYRAVSRGITPDNEIQPATKLGMERDGIDTSRYVPAPVGPDVVSAALRVVTLGVAKIPDYFQQAQLRQWDDVPAVSRSYEGARDHLRARIDELLDELHR